MLGFASVGRSSVGRGRDVQPMEEPSGLGWREILLLACSYPYLDEEKRNQLIRNGIAAFDHRVVDTG